MLIDEGSDVTDQKRQADALRKSDERLRLAVHASGIGIFDHGHRTGTVFWSPEMHQICSVGADTPGSLQRYADLVHPEDRERVSTAIARAHASDGDGVFNIEHRIVRLTILAAPSSAATNWSAATTIARVLRKFFGSGGTRNLDDVGRR